MTIEELAATARANVDVASVMRAAMDVDQDELRSRLRRLEYRDFQKTTFWFAVASTVKERDGHTCRNPKCLKSSGVMHAHHTTYSFLGADHRHMELIVCLCSGCHKKHHDMERAMKERLNAELLLGAKSEHQEVAVKPVGHRSEKNERRRLRRLRRQQRRAVREAAAGLPRPKAGKVLKPLTNEQIAWVEQRMPEGDPITLTYDLIYQCWTDWSGQTNETLRHLGQMAPLISGWVDDLVGTQLSSATYRKALEGRFHYKTGRLPRRPYVQQERSPD